MVFSASAGMDAACQCYGQVLALSSPDPSKCYIITRNTAVAERESTAVIRVVNFQGEPCEAKTSKCSGDLKSFVRTDIRASLSVERAGKTQYKISYKPAIKGRHQLCIKVEGQNIKGSPFSIDVKPPADKLCSSILSIWALDKPWGVTINHSGKVVTTDFVSVFSSSGEKLQSFGTCGSEWGQFQCPRGIVVDGEGNILVADSLNSRIQKFAAEGQFLTSMRICHRGGPQPSPSGIAFNANNEKVYVTDQTNHKVIILNSDLIFSGTFGMKGSIKGQFNIPLCIACDSNGKVYVADSVNHCIQIFTQEGKFVNQIKRFNENKCLKTPVGVAINTGMVYVSDVGRHCVLVFTSEGHYVSSFGRENCPLIRLTVDDCAWSSVCV